MTYLKAYQSLPEKLAEKYIDLNFENHCYLRIAQDNAFETKWDKTLKNRLTSILVKVSWKL